MSGRERDARRSFESTTTDGRQHDVHRHMRVLHQRLLVQGMSLQLLA